VCLLLILDVQLLYDSLLNEERERRELDMPWLLCSSPFLHAATQAVNITRVGPAAVAGPAVNTANTGKAAVMQPQGRGGVAELHMLELSGPLLPSSVVRLLSLLRLTQRGSLRGFFALSDLPCAHLNCISSVIQMDSLRGLPYTLGLCQQESLKQQVKTNMAGRQPINNCGPLRRIKCGEGVPPEMADAGEAPIQVELNSTISFR